MLRTMRSVGQHAGKPAHASCFKRRVLGLALALALLCLAWGANVGVAQESAGIPDEVLADLERMGVVPLIVQFDLPGLSAGELAAAADAHVPLGADAVAAIAEAQQVLLARMAQYELQNVKLFPFTPGLALALDSVEALEALYADPDVAAIVRDVPVPPALDSNVRKVSAQFAHALAYRGTGQTIAILDTGVDKFHPALSGKVVAEACYSTAIFGFSQSACPGGLNATTPNSGLHCTGASGCDHGTHVAAIAAGVAPGATLIAMQVFSKVTDPIACNLGNYTAPCTMSFPSDYLLALNRVYALRNSYKIAAVNLSLGGGLFPTHCDFDPTKGIIDSLRGAGTLTVIAAGNDGFRNAMGLPACISTAVSVANSDITDRAASSTNISSWTTLFAPGGPIYAAIPNGQYTWKNGTSMAAPMVAGALAVWRSAKPDITANELRNLLVTTGPFLTDQRSNGIHTRRRLDVYDGLCKLVTCDNDDFGTMSTNATRDGSISPGTDRDHFYMTAVAGNRVTIALNRLSGSMDPYVELFAPNGTRLAVNNNGGGNSNALINDYYLSQSGTYLVVASSFNNQTGQYRLQTSTQAVNLNPAPFTTALSPASATGTLSGADFWVRIDGGNFMPTSQVRWNGALRAMFYTSPSQIWMRVLGSDLGLPWPRTALITVTNPGPGGGSSAPRSFSIAFPILGESELVQPASGVTVTTDVKTTFVISWTVPITQVPFSWRAMQNMDLRLRDDEGNVAAWIRVNERITETSTMRLLNAAASSAVISDTNDLTATLNLPLEGIPGVDSFDIVISDTVTLHLADSAFSGSGPTAIMSPTVTFGPNALGRYNIEFRVDGPDGEIQDDDILGVIHIVPAECPVAVTGVSLTGPAAGLVGEELVFSADLAPLDATGSVTVTWSPEPQGIVDTTTVTYSFASAGVQTVFVNVENCGGFAADVAEVDVTTGPDPDLALGKRGPLSAVAGEPITYTLTVTNHGAMTATNVVVVDEIPSGASYVEGGVEAGQTVLFDLAELPGVGASVEMTFVVTANTTITNQTYSLTADGGITATGEVSVVTALAAAQVELSPTLTTTLVYTGETSGVQAAALAALSRISVTFVGGSVFEATTVALHADVVAPAGPPTDTVAVAHFALAGYRAGGALPAGTTLGEAAPLELVYPAGAVNGLVPASLRLLAWDGTAWSDAGIACSHDAAATRLDCTLETPALTVYMLVGEEEEEEEPPVGEQLYLPAVIR